MGRLISLELNELNFDFIERYIERGRLPTFAKLLSKFKKFETLSEEAYPNLEPWIQWPTVYTGLSYGEHGIFRLGDGVGASHPQIWESLEAQGISVGAICPMNAPNRCRDPDFFLPDPWTLTKATGDRDLLSLFNIVRSTVNENAHDSRIVATARALLPHVLRYASLSSSLEYFRILNMSRKYRWARSTFLDRFLADVFLSLFKAKRTRFASLFLNAGAHIQHHHMFESGVYDGQHENPSWYSSAGGNGVDPLLFVYRVYDGILADMLALPDTRVLITTGLSQVPNTKAIYQYRFVNHAASLKRLRVIDFEVEPRMSRDFLLTFRDRRSLESAKEILSRYHCHSAPLFSIDDRKDSLFCQIGYFGPPDGLSTVFDKEGNEYDLSHDVVLVSIENGIHRDTGFHFDTNVKASEGPSVIPLTQVHLSMSNAFELPATVPPLNILPLKRSSTNVPSSGSLGGEAQEQADRAAGRKRKLNT